MFMDSFYCLQKSRSASVGERCTEGAVGVGGRHEWEEVGGMQKKVCGLSFFYIFA